MASVVEPHSAGPGLVTTVGADLDSAGGAGETSASAASEVPAAPEPSGTFEESWSLSNQ